MTDSREVVGFFDKNGLLNQWFVSDCRLWSFDKSLQPGTVFCQSGVYVWWSGLDRALGQLARILPAELAAELMLGHGYELPCDLVRFLAEHQDEKPKTQTRSKPRRPRRPPKSQHGLRGIANRARQRESRAGNPETHDTQGH